MIGQTLDSLQKNRARTLQVGRARALMEIALRERGRRELLESQVRQKEEMQRCRGDFQLQQETKTHRELVDAFVLRAQKSAVSTDAAARAKALAHAQVTALVELDVEVSRKAGAAPQDALRDILQTFLLPEVDRRL